MYSIRETFVFQTEIYTFRIFIPSLCCFFFLSLPWGSVFFSFFFSTRRTRTCRCHGKWSFFGSSVFLVVKNPSDLRSQIRFWILPKKRKATNLFSSANLYPPWSSPLSCRRYIGEREDPAGKVGHFMWTYIEVLLRGWWRCRSDFDFKLVSSKISFLLAR